MQPPAQSLGLSSSICPITTLAISNVPVTAKPPSSAALDPIRVDFDIMKS
jgi:hypothetical protein